MFLSLPAAIFSTKSPSFQRNRYTRGDDDYNDDDNDDNKDDDIDEGDNDGGCYNVDDTLDSSKKKKEVVLSRQSSYYYGRGWSSLITLDTGS